MEEDIKRQSNIKALKLGSAIFGVVFFIGLYNLLVKVYLDPCCQTHTLGEYLLVFSKFFSYILGGGIFALVIFIVFRLAFRKIFFQRLEDGDWRKEERVSALNLLFVVILFVNFLFLFLAQLPYMLIGCTECKPPASFHEIERGK